MDAHPTIVLNDALGAAKDDLTRAADAMSAVLIEQLGKEPHFAQFTISVSGNITNPVTGEEVARIEHKLPYTIYWDRDPSMSDGTE